MPLDGILAAAAGELHAVDVNDDLVAEEASGMGEAGDDGVGEVGVDSRDAGHRGTEVGIGPQRGTWWAYARAPLCSCLIPVGGDR